MTATIYGTADVAAALGVSNAAVSNHLARHTDTPRPRWTTTSGRLYWDAVGLQAWRQWHSNRKNLCHRY